MAAAARTLQPARQLVDLEAVAQHRDQDRQVEFKDARAWLGGLEPLVAALSGQDQLPAVEATIAEVLARRNRLPLGDKQAPHS